MKRIKIKYLIIPVLTFFLTLGIFYLCKYVIEYQIGLTDVYVAKLNIRHRTKIKESHLSKIRVPKAYIEDTAYIDSQDIIGKYVVLDGFIAKGSPFYKEYLEDENKMEDGYYTRLKNGESAYDLRIKDIEVNTASIKQGQYVDLYLTINRQDVISDLIIEGARIIGVYDNQNREVLSNSDTNISTITIALQKEMIPYLNKAFAIGEIKLVTNSNLYNEQICKMNLSEEILKYLS